MACSCGRDGGLHTTDTPRTKRAESGEIPGASVASTVRNCKARIVNRWKIDISDVTLRHRRGNKSKGEDKATWGKIAADDDSSAMTISFETGLGAPGDYWWVQFTAAGKKWTCKDNFYCDLRSDDERTVVDCILKKDDEDLHVSMNSGSCDVSLYQK